MRKTLIFESELKAIDVIGRVYEQFIGNTTTIRLEDKEDNLAIVKQVIITKDNKAEYASVAKVLKVGDKVLQRHKHINGGRIDIVKLYPEIITPAEYDKDGKEVKEAIIDSSVKYLIVYPDNYVLPISLELFGCENKEELKEWIKAKGLEKEVDLRLNYDKLILALEELFKEK